MIRNFLYLDSLKLKSHSSQIFEGMTEYIINSATGSTEQNEQQRGPVGSGRVIGDILRKEGASSEFKFLEDYAYSIFEDKLANDNLLGYISDHPVDFDFTKPYVKVTSRTKFNDMRAVQKLIGEFNSFGEAIYRVTNQAEVAQTGKGKVLTDNAIREAAKLNGLQLDKKFLDSLNALLKFGYEDLIEADMLIGDILYSAPLRRQYLREDENLLIHKYSRYTQIELSLVGIIVRQGKSISKPPNIQNDTGLNLKQALRNFIFNMEEIENNFLGQSENEVVIDPVAIYATL